MPFVIVECAHEKPLSPDELRAATAQLWMCLLVREVVFVASYAAQNGKRLIWVLEARDAESVRNAFRSSGTPFERAWSADSFSPPP
jgi:hypothetical protein